MIDDPNRGITASELSAMFFTDENRVLVRVIDERYGFPALPGNSNVRKFRQGDLITLDATDAVELQREGVVEFCVVDRWH